MLDQCADQLLMRPPKYSMNNISQHLLCHLIPGKQISVHIGTTLNSMRQQIMNDPNLGDHTANAILSAIDTFQSQLADKYDDDRISSKGDAVEFLSEIAGLLAVFVDGVYTDSVTPAENP